jgi:hypothetical protein
VPSDSDRVLGTHTVNGHAMPHRCGARQQKGIISNLTIKHRTIVSVTMTCFNDSSE